MKKLLVFLGIVLVLGLVSSARANLVVNGDWSTGDETGWTRWRAPWGWFQRIPVSVPGPYTVSADWAGDIDGLGWAEVMLFSCTDGLSNDDVIARIDVGNFEDIAFKKDSWGMNPPTAWDWEPASLSPHPQGNGGVIEATCPEIVVALKLGSTSYVPVWTSWDNITVVPEPATLAVLAMGGGLALLKRRR